MIDNNKTFSTCHLLTVLFIILHSSMARWFYIIFFLKRRDASTVCGSRSSLSVAPTRDVHSRSSQTLLLEVAWPLR